MFGKFYPGAKSLILLDHPNICRLTDFFRDGNRCCFVMEYVQGTQLKKLLQQKKKLPYDLAFKIAKQTLEGFQYAHKSGILHWNIEPANIIVDKHGNSKIMNFGISVLESGQKDARFWSAFNYVSPERCDPSKKTDVISCIYSLGLVFYELFAGRKPFDTSELSLSQVMYWQMFEIPEPPSTYAGELPPHISAAILKSLEKNPDDRFKDFRDFKAAMDPGSE